MYLKINLESAYNEKNIHVKKYFFEKIALKLGLQTRSNGNDTDRIVSLKAKNEGLS